MLPPQKYAFFALTGGICKVNNFSPRKNILVCAGFLVCNVCVGKRNAPAHSLVLRPGFQYAPNTQPE